MNTESSLMFHLAVDQPYTGPGLCVTKQGIALLKLIREAHRGVMDLDTLFNFCDGRHQDRCDEFIELMAHSLACHSQEFVRDVMEAAAMSASIRESGNSASADNGRDAASLDPFADPTEDEIEEMARTGSEALGTDVTPDDIRKAVADVHAEAAELGLSVADYMSIVLQDFGHPGGVSEHADKTDATDTPVCDAQDAPDEHRAAVEKGVVSAICILGPKVFGDELVAKAKETLKTAEMKIADKENEDSLP